MPIARARALVLACGVLAGWSAGCARQPLRGVEARGLDRKLSTFAYIEEGDLVSLIVDTRPARYRDGEPYMPLEVLVANRGLKQLTLTRESFTLIDAAGKRYPLAGARELLEGYEHLDTDRELGELPGIVFNKFATFVPQLSHFSPTRTVERPSNIVIDRVALARFSYVLDYLYFPTPPAGIRDQRFELIVDSGDLEDPVFVKFEVR